MNYFKLTREKLSVETISDLVAHESCGAISVFAGTTRDNFEEKKVLSLEYEAYEPMAVKQIEKICEELRSRWSDVVNIAVYHRLGVVPVREASVVIAVSSPHRKSSLDAVAFAIDELKKLVPIWKKEQYEGNESAWKENKESGNSKLFKRPKIDFSSCVYDDEAVIAKSLVQISADEHEIIRRIERFVERKREEIDLCNILDYTENKSDMLANELIAADTENEEHSSCARTNSVIIKQEGSKCLLRVSRVKNQMGPQIRPDYLQTLDKLMTNSKSFIKVKMESSDVGGDTSNLHKEIHNGLQERLSNMEDHLNINVGSTKNVFFRIKELECRLLHLESISPEYKHFLGDNYSMSSNLPKLIINKGDNRFLPHREIYTAHELETIIEQMKQNDSDKDEKKHNHGIHLH